MIAVGGWVGGAGIGLGAKSMTAKKFVDLFQFCPLRKVGNFRQNNCSVEAEIDETNDYFRQNSGYSAEQKILGVLFRTIPRERKMLGIPYR